jgi:ribokinase
VRRASALAGVYVVGSINTDLVVYVERLPAGGETLFGERFAQFAGGKGANQAVAAARAGARTAFYGAVGDDAYGRAGRASLEQAGVAGGGLLTLPEHPSGVALIVVDGRGENQIVVAPGANLQFDAERVAPPQAASAVLLLQNEIAPATTFSCARRWHAAGARVVWNLAPAPAAVPPADVLSAAEFVLVNELELAALREDRQPSAGPQEIAPAARALVGGKGTVRNLIVTLGAEGCLWARRGVGGTVELHRQPALPVSAVDTVGAGDCFGGVFAAALAAGAAIEAALQRASAAAALSVQRAGAQPSMPARAAIDAAVERLAGHPRE